MDEEFKPSRAGGRDGGFVCVESGLFSDHADWEVPIYINKKQ